MSFNGSHGPETGEAEVVVEEEVPIDDFRLSAAFHHDFASLDDVNLESEFRHRATVMWCPPKLKFLSGVCVSAMRVAMQEIRVGRAENDELRRDSWEEALLHAAPHVVAEAREGWFGPQIETPRTVCAICRWPVDGFDRVQQGGGSCREQREGTTHQKIHRFSGTEG